MRDMHPLEERHLIEAVRRGLLTEEQLEAVRALARTMTRAEGGGMPDLRWVTIVHAIASGAAVLGAMILGVAQMDRTSPLAFVVLGTLLVGTFAALSFWMQKRSSGGPVAGVLGAGAASVAWMVGTGLYQLTSGGRSAWPQYGEAFVDNVSASRNVALCAGAGAIVAVGLGLVVLRKISAAMAPVGVALLAITAALGENALRGTGYSGDRPLAVLVLGACAVMLLAGLLWSRLEARSKWRTDSAAWLLNAALFFAGVAMLVRGERSSSECFVYALVSLLLAPLGARLQRPVFYLASAAGVLLFPLLAMGNERAGAEVMAVWLGVVTVGIAFAASKLRRSIAARWRDGQAQAQEERSLWAAPA